MPSSPNGPCSTGNTASAPSRPPPGSIGERRRRRAARRPSARSARRAPRGRRPRRPRAPTAPELSETSCSEERPPQTTATLTASAPASCVGLGGRGWARGSSGGSNLPTTIVTREPLLPLLAARRVLVDHHAVLVERVHGLLPYPHLEARIAAAPGAPRRAPGRRRRARPPPAGALATTSFTALPLSTLPARGRVLAQHGARILVLGLLLGDLGPQAGALERAARLVLRTCRRRPGTLTCSRPSETTSTTVRPFSSCEFSAGEVLITRPASTVSEVSRRTSVLKPASFISFSASACFLPDAPRAPSPAPARWRR